MYYSCQNHERERNPQKSQTAHTNIYEFKITTSKITRDFDLKTLSKAKTKQNPKNNKGYSPYILQFIQFSVKRNSLKS